MLVDGLDLKKYGDAAVDKTLGFLGGIGNSFWNFITGDDSLEYGSEEYNSRLKALGYDEESINKEIKATKNNVDYEFDNVLDKHKDLKGADRFKAVVNELKDRFEDRKYSNEMHLAETYASVLERLATEFNRNGENPIDYGYTGGLFTKDGNMIRTGKVDCTNLQTLAINILGLSKEGGYNVNLFSQKIYAYDIDGRNSEKILKASANFRYNTDLFEFVNIDNAGSFNLRGTIGVTQLHTEKGLYLDHVYTALGEKNGIVDSSWNDSGPKGITIYKGRKWNNWNIYKSRTAGFLRLRLHNSRKYTFYQ